MIKTIANLGISPDIDKELVSKIRFSNVAGALLSVLTGLSIPLYYFMGLTELGLFLVPVSIGYFAVTLLNSSGFYTIARAVLLSVFILGAFYYSSRLGHHYAIQYLLIASIVGVQILFHNHEAMWRSGLSFVTFILWLVYETTVFNPIPIDTQINPENPLLTSVMVIMVGTIVFGSIALVFSYLRKEDSILKEAIAIAETDKLTILGTQFLLKNHNELKSPQIDYKLVVLEVHGLRRVNELHGWEFGDEIIKFFSQALKSSFPDLSEFYRLNPTLFAVWAPKNMIQSRVEESLEFLSYDIAQSSFPEISFSVGTSLTSEAQDTSELIMLAQTRLIKYVPAKNEFE